MDMAENLTERTPQKREYPDDERARIRQIGYYTICFIIVLAGIAIMTRLYPAGLDDMTKLIIYVACSGGLGGLAFSIYGYTKHLLKNDFDLNAVWWYIMRPFIGIVYGSFAFFFIAGGLMTLSGTSQPVAETLFTTKTVMFYCALAFLTGYSESSFTAQLKELAEAVFKTPENNQTGTPPESTGTGSTNSTDQLSAGK